MDPMTMAAMSDPELAQMLAQLGSIPDEQKMLMGQMGLGNERRGTPSARGTDLGRVYVAASPLEHLAVAMERRRGGQQMQAAQQGMQDTLTRQNRGRSALADALVRMFGGGNAQPIGPVQMPEEIR